LLYSGLAWPGISTAFVTCCFVALGNTGATIYKSWLRLAGCVVGGALGYVAILEVVPYMESIVSLVMLTVVVSAAVGWVAAGSERIAYAGLQAAFAFYLCVFQGFEPGFNLTIARDRLVGIIIGTVVSGIVFRFIWPEHAADGLRVALCRVLGDISKLVRMPQPEEAHEIDGKAATSLHQALSKDLDSILVLSEQAAVENVMFRNPRGFSPAALERLTAHIQALGLMVTALLRRTKLEEWQQLDVSVQRAEAVLRAAIANYLTKVSGYLEKGERPRMDEIDAALAAWEAAVTRVTGNDRLRLIRRLLGQTRELV
jgi:uncharacterized membrane protein YccC